MKPEAEATLWKSFWSPLLFFTLVALVMVGPFVFPATQMSTLSYDSGDAFIFMWNFWWTKQAFVQLENPYWTDLVFYPDGSSLSFHSYPLPYSVLSLPVQYCMPGLRGAVAAYNLVIFFSFVFSGFGAYRLAYHLVRNSNGSGQRRKPIEIGDAGDDIVAPPGEPQRQAAETAGSRPRSSAAAVDRSVALIAGLMFAYMPFHVLNMSRLHVAAIEFLPFYVHSLLLLRERPQIGRACGVGLWLALTYYTSLEYALYLVIFSVVWLIHVMIKQRHHDCRDLLRKLCLSALAFFLLSSPLLYQQAKSYAAGWYQIEQPLQEAFEWSPALAWLLTPNVVHPVYGADSAFSGTLQDQRSTRIRGQAALGLGTCVLAVVSLFSWRRDERRFWAVAAAVFLALALGPYLRLTETFVTEIPMPWLALYKWLPPFRGGRAPARFLPLAMLMLSILAALGARDILSRIKTRRARVTLTILIAALVIFEDLAGWSANKIEPQAHPFFATLADEPSDYAIMDLTPELPDSLLAHIVHGKPTVEWRGFIVRSRMRNQQTPFVELEHEFNLPHVMQNLDRQERTERLDYFRQVIHQANVRYIMFPAESFSAEIVSLRIKLARLLGARVVLKDDHLVVCRFGHQPAVDDLAP